MTTRRVEAFALPGVAAVLVSDGTAMPIIGRGSRPLYMAEETGDCPLLGTPQRQWLMPGHGGRIRQCMHCLAVHGKGTREETERIVLPDMADDPEPGPEGMAYYDFLIVDGRREDGHPNIVGRRHGWFDIASRRILQAG